MISKEGAPKKIQRRCTVLRLNKIRHVFSTRDLSFLLAYLLKDHCFRASVSTKFLKSVLIVFSTVFISLSLLSLARAVCLYFGFAPAVLDPVTAALITSSLVPRPGAVTENVLQRRCSKEGGPKKASVPKNGAQKKVVQESVFKRR